jgi:exonuclease V
LSELHKSSISISDISSQYWCERQMEYNYRYGRRITEEIKGGRLIHEELEEETNVPVILQPKSYADAMYKNLYESCVALDSLKKNGKTREVRLYGFLSSYKLVGKVDELQFEDGTTMISEDKTRASAKIPSESQMLTHKIQVLLYRRLLGDIVAGRYTSENFRKAYGTSTLRITEEFRHQLGALGIGTALQSVDAVADSYFKGMLSLRVSDTLQLRYIDQFTGNEIKLYKFQYSNEEAQQIVQYALKYWDGERKSLPVPEQESWKCNYCVFFGKECKVWWPQKVL